MRTPSVKMCSKKPKLKSLQGFSLIETAIALAVFGLVALLLIGFWKTASQVRVVERDAEQLARAQAAVLSYVYVNARLPCAAADKAGVEVFSCPAATTVGYLPWRTLGLPDAAAGNIRYGVYRNTAGDLDLTERKDRFAPLVPDNTITINSGLVSINRLLGNANNLDFCAALSKMAAAPTAGNPLYLHTIERGGVNRRNVAFALALPGLLDADGDGQAFDGNQISTGSVFDAPSRPRDAQYDDTVLATSPQTMFASMSCSLGLTAAGHTHFNTLNSAQIMAKGMSDYSLHLNLAALAADANVAGGIATVFSAAAGLATATAALALAVANTTLTYGTFAVAVVAGGVAVAAAAAAVAAAAVLGATAIAAAVEANATKNDFANNMSAATALAQSVRTNALAGDAAGL